MGGKSKDVPVFVGHVKHTWCISYQVVCKYVNVEKGLRKEKTKQKTEQTQNVDNSACLEGEEVRGVLQ